MEEWVRSDLIGLGAPAALGLVAGVAAVLRKRKGVAGRPRPDADGADAREEFVSARAIAVMGLTAAFFVSFYGHWGAPIWPPESFRRGSYLDRLFLAPPLIGLIGL